MQTLVTRRRPLARKLVRPAIARPDPDEGACQVRHAAVPPCSRPPRPTRGPRGEVMWWERPAPGGHERLWEAVCHLHARRLQLGLSVAELARRLTDRGHRITRETLSRVLNGKQPTSWRTVEALADLLGADVDAEPHA